MMLFPQDEGWLPRWLFLVCSTGRILSTVYSAQSFVSLKGAKKIFTAPTTILTGLQSRSFGTWSTLSTVVRFYSVYNIHDRVAYELCMYTWAIAIAYFGSEWLIFGSAEMGPGLASPMVVASTSLIWMVTQYGHYVG